MNTKTEEEIQHLKKVFAERFPYATLKIVQRKGTMYFTVKGCYRREALATIELFFPDAFAFASDYETKIFKYKDENETLPE